MTEPRRKPGRRRGRARQANKRKAPDLWSAPAARELPAVEPIRVAPDPTALIRSLGEPPLHSSVSGHYLGAVVARAADLAAALAASAGLLAGSDLGD